MTANATTAVNPSWPRWAAVLAWMGLIFYMSAQPNSGEQSGFLTAMIFQLTGVPPTPDALHTAEHLLRKTAHFSEYAILAVLLAGALPAGRSRWALAWIVATFYAATDEWHQSFVPNRGPSPVDVGIDSAGALFGTLAHALAARLRKRPLPLKGEGDPEESP